ncbi:MAG: competence/damage-inducible protein A [Gammaproteobacteria bacterium]
MTRDSAITTSNRIALLATGDEIINGDILNSNSQIIAQKLFSQGMHVGLHMAVSDNVSEIQQAIEYLLASHRALIITGGLGPTSDDITRYALGKALHRPLVFNAETWEFICERFKILGYKGEPPEGNRQQALFPEDALIIPNPHGTAAGCAIYSDDKSIFMLPGPPFECLPMVDSFVLPALRQQGFKEITHYGHWLLFGVSESVIAEQLDNLVKPYDCKTGYRLAYPYIEFKLYSNNETDFNILVPQIEQTIAPYLISDGKQTASAMLQKKLEKLNYILTIKDSATGGLLESIIKTQKTRAHLDFASTNPTIEIRGLTEFWQNHDTTETQLEILFKGNTISKNIPLRGRVGRVKLYAVEFICQQIFQFISIES